MVRHSPQAVAQRSTGQTSGKCFGTALREMWRATAQCWRVIPFIHWESETSCEYGFQRRYADVVFAASRTDNSQYGVTGADALTVG